jgi:L-ascorbate metabolism protein UlaG (beta-lactamase superfamily)
MVGPRQAGPGMSLALAGARGARLAGPMRVTKFGHACVRIETDGATVVLDPGGWSEREAVDGATAVLITHEHPDHLDPDNLRATDAPIHTIRAVADQIRDTAPDVAERVRVVASGEAFELGDVAVRVVGERHAVIHPELPRLDNSGYLLQAEERRIFHPGDALTVPEEDLDLLLVPVQAPWSNVSEVMDYAREVRAPLTAAIHDGLLNERGLGLLARMVGGTLEQQGRGYVRVEPRADIDLP